MTFDELNEKWSPVLDFDGIPSIEDNHRRAVTAQILENSEGAFREAARLGASQGLLTEAPTNVTGSNVDTFDPVLISLVRRALPNLIAYDICGVQPMTGPTGLIFAMRAREDNQTGAETFYNEVNTDHSSGGDAAADDTIGGEHRGTVPGSTAQTTLLAQSNTYNYMKGMSTANAETNGSFNEMAFSIEKVTVTATSRQLAADYSLELAQDMKAIHGLDTEAELANMLSAQILAEINREVVRTINVTAVRGSNVAQTGVTTAGVFDLDTDANGRWLVEKFKGMMFHIEQEANRIAKDTRRGKGNIILCSSDVASALNMAGILDYAPALNSNNLQVDDTGVTFAGVVNGRYRVYIDPYASGNYMTVGYKGSNIYDAGLFYCPYVPLQMVRAVETDTFQPRIGFKTRYGMAPNPFAKGITAASATAAMEEDTNVYYRRTIVSNLK